MKFPMLPIALAGLSLSVSASALEPKRPSQIVRLLPTGPCPEGGGSLYDGLLAPDVAIDSAGSGGGTLELSGVIGPGHTLCGVEGQGNPVNGVLEGFLTKAK